MDLEDRLEKAWNEQEPSCLSCGWSPCFYEVRDNLDETDKEGEYHALCVSKDDDDSYSHRGYYVYLK